MRALLIALALVAAVAAAVYYLRPASPPPPPAPPAPIEAPPALPQAQAPRYPVEAPPAEAAPPAAEPLPPLKESDPALMQAGAKVLGAATLQKFFNLEELAHRFVATVDNLPREAYASRLNPVKPVGGLFLAQGRDETLEISPKNTARYGPLVAMVEAIDAKQAVDLYIHFYPLFQQAYVNLGYPQGYFNDRLVEVIDHLLAAPELEGPVKLVQPHVLYEFADPELEARSAGQKALMRVGPENARRLKAKLREIRKELVARRAAR